MSETDVVNEEVAAEKVTDKTDEQTDVVADDAKASDAEELADVLELESGESELEQVRREAEDWRARAYRAAADLDNGRKRFQKEREDLRKYGSDGLLKDLVPVADNLQRAISHSAAGDGLLEGVEMVLRQFKQVLGSHGARPFESKGEPFDPQLHEAMTQVPTDEHAPGTVVDVYQEGWKLHDRLARPAMVTVATAPRPAPKGADGPSKEADAAASDEITANDVDADANDVDNG